MRFIHSCFFAAVSTLLACGSNGSAGSNGAALDGGAGGNEAGSGGSGGQDNGTGGVQNGTGGGSGAAGTGGTDGSGGVAGAGGAGAFGGAGASGGAGGSMAECRTANDCGMSMAGGFFECVPPGTTPQQGGGCGAPDWCGECVCPPEPVQPFGGGQSCDSHADCPNETTAPGYERYASICEAGQCTACLDDGDCTAEAPRCAMAAGGLSGGFADCFECTSDSDCPATAPVCDISARFGATGGACVVCVTAAHCAEGICQNNECVPQCTADGDCGPVQECVAKRCVAQRCSTTGDCPALFDCSTGSCGRRSCSSDADCGSGVCVTGACYEAPGTCYEVFAVP